VLFLWVSLFAFWFFDLRPRHVPAWPHRGRRRGAVDRSAPLVHRRRDGWVVTVATLLVTGLLMAWIRRSLEREREETARLAVVAERMRIARELHDAAGHGVTAVSLQAATGIRAIDDGADWRRLGVCWRRSSAPPGSRSMTCASCSAVLRPSDGGYPERDRVSLSHLDVMLDECRTAGLNVKVERSGDQLSLPPILDQTAYRIIQEALTTSSSTQGRARQRGSGSLSIP